MQLMRLERTRMVTKTTTSLELQQDSADKRPILLIITHATGFFLILTSHSTSNTFSTCSSFFIRRCHPKRRDQVELRKLEIAFYFRDGLLQLQLYGERKEHIGDAHSLDMRAGSN